MDGREAAAIEPRIRRPTRGGRVIPRRDPIDRDAWPPALGKIGEDRLGDSAQLASPVPA